MPPCLIDREAVRAEIQPFLGISEVRPFKSDLVEINPGSLRNVIENYDETAVVLAGTEIEQFLT